MCTYTVPNMTTLRVTAVVWSQGMWLRPLRQCRDADNLLAWPKAAACGAWVLQYALQNLTITCIFVLAGANMTSKSFNGSSSALPTECGRLHQRREWTKHRMAQASNYV